MNLQEIGVEETAAQEIAARRLASAVEMLEKVLAKMDAQYESLNAKVDRIVAAVEETSAKKESEEAYGEDVQASSDQRIAELEKKNRDLHAQAERAMRKTMSPMVTAILAKGGGSEESYSSEVVERVLEPLSVEQRIAVKAEMARAGLIL